MKILIVAHTPPPYHGQSFMVQQILDGLPKAWRGAKSLTLLHLNIRYSTDVHDIGKRIFQKAWLLTLHACTLFWMLIKERPDYVYFVPAPGKPIAIYRDWILIGITKFLGFARIFHWLAGGLDQWLHDHASPIKKSLTQWVYRGASLSILPVSIESPLANTFSPKRLAILPTGIPDPCPNFETQLLIERQHRLASRRSDSSHAEKQTFHALFMGHCIRSKGLFDAIEAVRLANQTLKARGSSMQICLSIFGQFTTDAERNEFTTLQNSAPWQTAKGPHLTWKEFVHGDEKEAVFQQSDVLCFPTFYPAELIPTVILDALAHGLPIAATHWRGIPEMIPQELCPTTPIQRPDLLAEQLLALMDFSEFQKLRTFYLENFSSTAFLQGMETLLRTLKHIPAAEK